MNSVAQIAASGLNAATQRLDVAAGNIANALTPAYVPLQVDQVALAGGGTTASVAPIRQPSAAGVGPVMSNVDLAQQMTQVMLAHLSFAANARVFASDAAMNGALLDIAV
jgi:flagellar basal-body rod protein FlgC